MKTDADATALQRTAAARVASHGSAHLREPRRLHAAVELHVVPARGGRRAPSPARAAVSVRDDERGGGEKEEKGV